MSVLRRTIGRHAHDDKEEESGEKSDDEEMQQQQQDARSLSLRRVGRKREREAGTAEEKTSLLLQEDGAAGGKSIYKSDILKFIRVYLPNDPKQDHSDIFPKSTEYTIRDDRRVVFVERAKDGQFVPVYLPTQDVNAMVQTTMQASEHDAANVDEETALLDDIVPATLATPEVLGDPTTNFNHCIRTVTLFCQGLFAGLACTTLYISSVAPDTTSFLENYQDIANEARRLMFVLAVISFVGALDRLVNVSNDRKANQDASAWDKTGMVLLVGLHCVCFLCTLVMSAVDTRIEYKDDHDNAGDDWADQALQDDGFDQGVASWLGLNVVRFATAVLAWTIASLRLWDDLKYSDAQNKEIQSAKSTIRSLTTTILELRGNRLDRVDETRLQQLIHIHKAALDRTQHALSVMQG